jgi:2-polyprenyl-6-methoxyphenol hydroxylase-like FAD-dependent oxidoreductase
MERKGLNVVIAGGGVAGTACAVALARIGAQVTVYEAYEDPAGPVGAFLSLAANGLRGLEVLGVLDQVRAAGFSVPRQRMWSGRGQLLGDVPRGRTGDDPMISVTLMRAGLVAVLRDEARRAGAEIVTGRRLGQDDLAARAGAEGAADLVVGADGIWSAARRFLDPAAPAPVYAGQYSVSGTSSGLGLEPGSWNMIYGRHGAFIYLPVPDGSVWWSAQVSSPGPAGPDATALGTLAARYAAEDRAASILRAADSGPGVTDLHMLAPVPRWHDDRTVLVGDAAHPVGSGQGASMAIEDAIVLAQELRRAGSVRAALTGYEERRRTRVGKMARTAAANRDAKVAGPVAARLRDLMMPLFVGRFYEKATAWLYAYDPGTLAGVAEAERVAE